MFVVWHITVRNRELTVFCIDVSHTMREMQMDNSFKRFFKWGSSYQNNVIPIAALGLQGKLSGILSHLNKGVTSFTR